MITYLTGDATQPQGDGNKVIAHICNDIGAWGAGFSGALSRMSPKPEQAYRQWSQAGRCYRNERFVIFRLGEVQDVWIRPGLWVVNMTGQRGIGKGQDGNPPIRYDAAATALRGVAARALELHASVHMPRIGCGLAGGTWDRMEPIILTELCDKGVPVFVYDLPGSRQ